MIARNIRKWKLLPNTYAELRWTGGNRALGRSPPAPQGNEAYVLSDPSGASSSCNLVAVVSFAELYESR